MKHMMILLPARVLNDVTLLWVGMTFTQVTSRLWCPLDVSKLTSLALEVASGVSLGLQKWMAEFLWPRTWDACTTLGILGSLIVTFECVLVYVLILGVPSSSLFPSGLDPVWTSALLPVVLQAFNYFELLWLLMHPGFINPLLCYSEPQIGIWPSLIKSPIFRRLNALRKDSLSLSSLVCRLHLILDRLLIVWCRSVLVI
jgi:hypothetical protein